MFSTHLLLAPMHVLLVQLLFILNFKIIKNAELSKSDETFGGFH